MNSGDLMTEEEEKSNDYPSSQVNVKSDQQVVPTADSVLDGPKGAQSVMAGPSHAEEYAHAAMNLALFDPPRWGWTAIGGIADVLPPHEVNSANLFKMSLMTIKWSLTFLSGLCHFRELEEEVLAWPFGESINSGEDDLSPFPMLPLMKSLTESLLRKLRTIHFLLLFNNLHL
jgi:hypothetical protein